MTEIISAEPEKLYRYAEAATRLDDELAGQGNWLVNRLAEFESTCRDPGSVAVGGLGENLHRCAGENQGWNQWVREVARQFETADRLMGIGHLKGLVSGGVALAGPFVNGGLGDVIKGIPVWLREKMAEGSLVLLYDGRTLAPGVDVLPQYYSVDPPLKNNWPNRNPMVYSNVINQFAVEHNKRYAPKGNDTYCNIFVWDVTKAMGVEIPHVIDKDGNSIPWKSGEDEQLVTEMITWLDTHGKDKGWRKATALEAQEMANNGHPAIAIQANYPHGHVAVVRPGQYDEKKGPCIAQAGASNFNNTTVSVGFRSTRDVEYYVNEPDL